MSVSDLVKSPDIELFRLGINNLNPDFFNWVNNHLNLLIRDPYSSINVLITQCMKVLTLMFTSDSFWQDFSCVKYAQQLFLNIFEKYENQ